MHSYIRSVATLVAVVASFSTESTFAQTTTRVSVSSGGAQGDADSGAQIAVAITPDDRFIAFSSRASNLAVGDTNGLYDAFVRDRVNGAVERVSVATGGLQGNADGFACSISADGRFVAFYSTASNLVASDTNGWHDVFVRDRTSGTTERVSVSTSGTQGNGNSYFPSFSADGRFVAFRSRASNLVAFDTNGSEDTFVRDRQTGTTERVSVSSTGAQGNDSSITSSISSDGRFVVFASFASNLVTGDTNLALDIFVRDRTSGTTQRVSVDSSASQANFGGYAPAISADGRCVAFMSFATNLVANDTNGIEDVFVRDLQSGITERVSVATGGAEGNYVGFNNLVAAPSLSADGRFVAFECEATNLVPGDVAGFRDIFVRDRALATTERVSIDSGGGEANSASYAPSISADGRFVVFDSLASDLVAGDTNGFTDVFLRDRGPLAPHAYCTSGTSSHGCVASIAANANPSYSLASPCNITVANVEGQKSGILFYGIDNSGFAPAPWAAGSTSVLCVKHPTQRTPIQNSGGTFGACDGSFVLDWNAYQATHPFALGNPWSVGDKVFVQAWFRDPLAVKSTNLSNAVELQYQF